MIRTIIVVLFLVIFFICTLPVLLVEWILHKRHNAAADRSTYHILMWVVKVVLFLSGTKLTIIGKENIPSDQPVLYVPNHKSFFDALLVYLNCVGPTGFVAKDSVKKVPFLNVWMTCMNCLFLDRSDIKKGLKTILTGIEQIKNGISMCIFPEGTRNKTGDEPLPFKEGSLKMAEKSGCPIVPVAITNSAQIFENHMPFIRSCHVIVEYGKPVFVNELEKEQKKFLGAYTRDRIVEMLNTHQEQL